MYVENQPNVLFAGLGAMDQSDYEVMAGLGQMDLSDYQIALGAQRRKTFSQPVALSVEDLPNPAFVGGLGRYRVPSPRYLKSKIAGSRPVKVRFKYGVPSIAGFGADGVDAGTAVAIGTAGLVVSAIVSFGMMTLASYVGARWAGCRRS
jgi:hypothetical protein